VRTAGDIPFDPVVVEMFCTSATQHDRSGVAYSRLDSNIVQDGSL